MRLLALLVILVGAGCQGCPGPAPVVNPSGAAGAPAPAPAFPATCAGVCALGTSLHCDFALPTPEGVPCVTFCQDYQDAKIAPWDLNCRAGKTTCSAIDTCP